MIVVKQNKKGDRSPPAGLVSLVGDADLLVQAFTLTLGLHSPEIVEGGVHQPSFIRVHRFKQSASAALLDLFGCLESHPDQLLLMTHAIVFTVDDDLQIRIDLTGIYIGQQLDGIKVLSLAADDDTGVVALNIQADGFCRWRFRNLYLHLDSCSRIE